MPVRRRLADTLARLRASLDWSVLEAFGPEPGGRGSDYLVYASARRAYWLLPREASTRRSSLALYAPQTVLGKLLHLNMRLGWFCLLRTNLNEDRVADFRARMEALLGTRNLHLAFSVGPPRPTQKVTVALIDGSRRVCAYAKIAFGISARAALDREREILKRLASHQYLRERIPGLLGSQDWCGGDVLVISPGPHTPGPSRLGAAHRDFLVQLHGLYVNPSPFTESGIRVRIGIQLRSLAGSLSHAWASRYEQAVGWIDATLAEVIVPTTLAHRDFTPWNTRSGPAGLFVFDWEAAQEGTTPGYDALHFRAIQAALMGRPLELEEWSSSFISAVWPAGRVHLPALWLTYLVDMSLAYANAHVVSAGVGDHGVLGWFGTEIDRFLAGDGPRWDAVAVDDLS